MKSLEQLRLDNERAVRVARLRELEHAVPVERLATRTEVWFTREERAELGKRAKASGRTLEGLIRRALGLYPIARPGRGGPGGERTYHCGYCGGSGHRQPQCKAKFDSR